MFLQPRTAGQSTSLRESGLKLDRFIHPLIITRAKKNPICVLRWYANCLCLLKNSKLFVLMKSRTNDGITINIVAPKSCSQPLTSENALTTIKGKIDE